MTQPKNLEKSKLLLAALKSKAMEDNVGANEIEQIRQRFSIFPQTISIPSIDKVSAAAAVADADDDNANANSSNSNSNDNNSNDNNPNDGSPSRLSIDRTHSIATMSTNGLSEEDEDMLAQLELAMKTAKGDRRDNILNRVQAQLGDLVDGSTVRTPTTRSVNSGRHSGHLRENSGHLRENSKHKREMLEKTQTELISMLEQMRACLKSTQEDLIKERIKRKARDQSMYKLARELGKRKQTLVDNEATIERLRSELASCEEEEALIQSELLSQKRANLNLRRGIKAECSAELAKLQQLYRSAVDGHQKTVSEMTRAHSKQREQLNLEVTQCNEELHSVRKEMEMIRRIPVHVRSTPVPTSGRRKRKRRRRIAAAVTILLIMIVAGVTWMSSRKTCYERTQADEGAETIYWNDQEEPKNAESFSPPSSTVASVVALGKSTLHSLGMVTDDQQDIDISSAAINRKNPTPSTKLPKVISNAQDRKIRTTQEFSQKKKRSFGSNIKRFFGSIVSHIVPNKRQSEKPHLLINQEK